MALPCVLTPSTRYLRVLSGHANASFAMLSTPAGITISRKADKWKLPLSIVFKAFGRCRSVSSRVSKSFLVKIFKIFRKPQIFKLIALPERMLALRLHNIITHDNYFYIAAERNAELVGQNL